MYEIMATMLILFKAITDCILALKRDDIKGVLINGFVHVLLLYLLCKGGLYD